MLADRTFLQATGLEIGDTIDVTVRLDSQTYEIVGEVDEGNFFFQPTVYLLRESWQDIKYGADEEQRPAASIVLLQGGDDIYGEFAGYEVVTKSTAFDDMEGVQGQQGAVVALRVFGYVIGALVIGVFFYVLTLQKVTR
ncbi:MAG: hypothetical protein U5Q44_14805 [Dehalococcoidia bacterium]|nr:hypothetical protein [Dehalococcoidia bacterium]